MNWQSLLPNVITVVVAVIGWVIAHRFNLSRDRVAKHREIRLTYLVGAYRALANWGGREPPYDRAHVDACESAVSDIQLLGTESQILRLRLALAEKNGDLGPLLKELRSELREQLDLPQIGGEVGWLRIDREAIKKAP